MYKIGEFSKLSKTTIKALRYYEKERLFLPKFVDENGYRYYEADQLIEISRIISLRQVGFSIEEIKNIMSGSNYFDSLQKKKNELEQLELDYALKISKINFLIGDKGMKYEVVVKELPECIVYFKEGIVEDFSKIVEFILQSADECLKLNPNIKCIQPDYCYSEYLDGEYKPNNFKYRYSQAVNKIGISDDNIKFKQNKATKAVCIYHKGPYETLSQAYGFIMKYVEDNNYKITDFPRERYIDGMWNKEDPNEWLTEIQVPIQ